MRKKKKNYEDYKNIIRELRIDIHIYVRKFSTLLVNSAVDKIIIKTLKRSSLVIVYFERKFALILKFVIILWISIVYTSEY